MTSSYIEMAGHPCVHEQLDHGIITLWHEKRDSTSQAAYLANKARSSAHEPNQLALKHHIYCAVDVVRQLITSRVGRPPNKTCMFFLIAVRHEVMGEFHDHVW